MIYHLFFGLCLENTYNWNVPVTSSTLRIYVSVRIQIRRTSLVFVGIVDDKNPKLNSIELFGAFNYIVPLARNSIHNACSI